MEINEKYDFSVIVCCYNSELRKIKKTLLSIYKQQDVSFEMIISDDGSTQNYEREIKEYCSKLNFINVKYNFLKSNVGTLNNILSALEKCEGKYIKIFSPGDFLNGPYVLKKYKNYFLETNSGLLLSDAIHFTDDGKVIKKLSPYSWNTTKIKYMRNNVCLYRDCLLGATICFDVKLSHYLYEVKDIVRLCEDFPFIYLCLAFNEKVTYIYDELIWYECGNGITSTGRGILKNEFKYFYEYLDSKYSTSNEYIKKSVKYYRIGEKPKMIKYFRYLFDIKFIIFKLSCKFNRHMKPIENDIRKIENFLEMENDYGL